MKHITLILSLFLFTILNTFSSYGQTKKISINDSTVFYAQKMSVIGDTMISGSDFMIRMNSTLKYIKTLKKALSFDNSFYYKFDSIKFMKVLYPADSQFRILNWNLIFNDGTFRYYGVIQYRSKELVFVPLMDINFTANKISEDSLYYFNKWFGTLYYKVIEKTHNKKNYYFLLGWQGHTSRSFKKIVEVLTFDNKGLPVFGAPVFLIGKKKQNRFILEYNSKAVVGLKYIKEKDLITFDHLVPPGPNSVKHKYTYIPDGTYDFLEFKKGHWVLNTRLFEKVDMSFLNGENINNYEPDKKIPLTEE